MNAYGSALELLLTSTGGRYLSRRRPRPPAAIRLSISANPLKTDFTVVGGLAAPVAAGEYVVVYNLGPGMAPAERLPAQRPGPTTATSHAWPPRPRAVQPALSLADNPFARQSEPTPSPGNRFQVSAARSPTAASARARARVLRRFAGYAIEAAMPATPQGGGSALLAARRGGSDDVFRDDPPAPSRCARAASSS